MKQVVAPYDMSIQSDSGVHGIILKAGEPTDVVDELFDVALNRGCSIPGGVPGQNKLDGQIVERLVSAMRLLRQVGNPDQLTATGEPRVAELKQIVPNFTPDQRKEAWEKVQAEEATVVDDEDFEQAEPQPDVSEDKWGD